MPVGLTDHKPLSQSKFRGLYNRGHQQSVPDNYFQDCLNNKFSTEEVSSRDGLNSSLAVTQTSIVRSFMYKRLGENPRFIYLKTDGSLWDSLFPAGPIYAADASFVDFSGVDFLNRFYITPHNRIEGIPGKSVIVYEGAGPGTARLAAGVAPTGYVLVAANSAVAGTVEAGVHLVAVAYVTASGFVTAPGSSIAQITAPGSKKLDITGIPVSGAQTKVLLATKSIPTSLFTGNPFGYEFFFVPGATLAAAAITATIDFYDADLITSADFLFDNLATIPAGVAIFVYNGHLVTVGEDGNNWTARVSEKYEPETFNAIDGFITVDPSDGGSGLRNGFEHRKSLVLCSADRLHATSDNDDVPSTWQVTVIDKSAGAEPFCIANILDSRGLQNDRAFIADRSGLLVFEGYVKKPELSWNIEGIWSRINKVYFNLVQVVDDPVNHRMFITVPLDTATAISHILYCDYSEAFTVYNTIDQNMVKWSIWNFPTVPKFIIGDKDNTTLKPVLHIGLTAGIYTMKDNEFSDAGTAIDSFWKSAYKEDVAGWIHHFGLIKARVIGAGNLQIYTYGDDDSGPLTSVSVALSSAPGGDIERLINHLNERCSVKFRVSLFNEYYVFNRFDLYTKPVYMRRPQ